MLSVLMNPFSVFCTPDVFLENESFLLCFVNNIFFMSPFSTEIPADDILELFGKTFFEFCQDSGYDKILQVLGATPRDFLQVCFVVCYDCWLGFFCT